MGKDDKSIVPKQTGAKNALYDVPDKTESAKKISEEKQDLLSKIKFSLNNKVKDVVISWTFCQSRIIHVLMLKAKQ